jgi:hypothetical protein
VGVRAGGEQALDDGGGERHALLLQRRHLRHEREPLRCQRRERAHAPVARQRVRRAGVNLASVTVQQMDNRVLERALIDRQVDAITAIGTSSIPVMMAQNAPHRFIGYSSVGLQFYSNVICASRSARSTCSSARCPRSASRRAGARTRACRRG